MASFDSDRLDNWLRWQERLHPKNIDLGLDRIKRVAEDLNIYSSIQSKNPTIVTVAGTNGKGTCVAALRQLLLRANKTVGAFTSPHLLRYNERVDVNGVIASDQDLVNAFRQIEAARKNISLTYHEFSTLAAVLIFLQAGLEYWIFEVGLGGRLDTVNMFDADVAIVTSIDLDHQEWLGNTREQIALEKAGIYRQGLPAICVDPNTPASLINYAREIGANLLLAPKDIDWEIVDGYWNWSGSDGQRNKCLISHLPLTPFSLASISAALQTMSVLGVDLASEVISQVLSDLPLPGRCQTVLWKERYIIFDVAHNPAASRYLANYLDQDHQHDKRSTIAVFAVMADKDTHEILLSMAKVVDAWHIAQLANVPRAATTSALGAVFAELNLTHSDYNSVEQALAAAMAITRPRDRVVVFGSFYTVAEGLQWLAANSSV